MAETSLSQSHSGAVRAARANGRVRRHWQVVPHAVLAFLVITSIYPFIFALLASLKNNTQFYSSFWAPTTPYHWENYLTAWKQLYQGFRNSVVVSGVSVIGVVLMASLTAWTFARYRWPGKEALYYLILSLLMIPFFLTLVPLYWMIRDLGLSGSLAGIALPYLAGGQVFPIFLMRTFFENLPGDLFDSARVDGAGEITTFFRIGLPLCTPIVITVAIMDIMGTWNDFFWPLVAAGQNASLHTVMVRTFSLTGIIKDYGLLTAAYVIISLPMILMFIFGMRYYVSGLTAGAIKL